MSEQLNTRCDMVAPNQALLQVTKSLLDNHCQLGFCPKTVLAYIQAASLKEETSRLK